MGMYTFVFQKLKQMIYLNQQNSNKIKIGFIQRHSGNVREMMSPPQDLCTDYVWIDARHIFFNYRDDQQAILCIEDYGKIDVSEKCVDLLMKVNDEFDDDILDDSTSSLRVLVFDNDSSAVYELVVLTIDILTSEEEAVITCKNCRKYC